jgi:hypothetical protein
VFDEPDIFQDEFDATPGPNEYVSEAAAELKSISRGYDPLDGGTGIVTKVGCPVCAAEFRFSLEPLDQWLAIIGKARYVSLDKTGFHGAVPCPRCKVQLTYDIGVDEIDKHGDIPISPLALLLPTATQYGKSFMETQREVFRRIMEKLTPWNQDPWPGFMPSPFTSYGETEHRLPRWLFMGVNRRLENIAQLLRMHDTQLAETGRSLQSIERSLSRIATSLDYFAEKDKKTNGSVISLTGCREATDEEINTIRQGQREKRVVKKTTGKRGGARKPS